MHCWKTINIEREYGTARLYILACIVFILVFCFSYIALSFQFIARHEAHHLWVFTLLIPFIYPIHKALHYFALFKYRKSVDIHFKIRYIFIPIVHMQLQQSISKKMYIFTLLTPFFLVNTALVVGGLYMPQYAHYFSFLLAFHSSVCLMDILYVKHLMSAPKNAIIEETPKGYEILVPLNL